MKTKSKCIVTTARTTLRAERADGIPGSTLMVMTSPATDFDGRSWARGTEFQPIGAGFANMVGRHYQTVMIGLDRVTFLFPQAPGGAS